MNSTEDKDYQEFLERKRYEQERQEELMFDYWNNLFFHGEYILKQIKECNSEVIVLAEKSYLGVDEPRNRMNCAIIGWDADNRIIYSYKKIIEVLMYFDKISEEEAREYFNDNLLGAYGLNLNPNKPIFMYEE